MQSVRFKWPKDMKLNDGWNCGGLRHNGKSIDSKEIDTLFGELKTTGVTKLLTDLGATKSILQVQQFECEEKKDDSNVNCSDKANKQMSNNNTGNNKKSLFNAFAKDTEQQNDASSASAAVDKNEQKLDAQTQQTENVFYDLGTGAGKVPLQAFLEFTTLTKCVGIEITDQRYERAEKNVLEIVRTGYNGRHFKIQEHNEGKSITIDEKLKGKEGQCINRICSIWCGSIFDYPGGIKDANICNVAVKFPVAARGKLVQMMKRTSSGSTFSSFNRVTNWNYDTSFLRELNQGCRYRYNTSNNWSKGNGGLYIYEKK